MITGNAGSNTLSGLAGNDTIEGRSGDDNLVGGSGNDYLIGDGNGASGNDTLDGGAGKDFIVAGKGDDFLYGGSGEDNLNGEDGNDILYGGSERDTLTGEAGNDVIYGGLGHDQFDGGSGNDTMFGEEGEDEFVGGSGEDVIYGGDDYDALYGGADNDALYGGGHTDELEGGGGNDLLDGGSGDDTMTGGTGNDTYVVDSSGDEVTESSSAGTDLVKSSVDYTLGANVENLGLTGSDSLKGTGNDLNNVITGNAGSNTLSGLAGNDSIEGRSGDDRLVGGSGDDSMSGGSGNDTLLAGAGHDDLYGGADNDILGGEAGDDELFGGDGLDYMLGGSGNDLLDGGIGNDTMTGESGNDKLYGGSGDDTFIYNSGDGSDTISDFNTGNSGAIDDGDKTNNDFVDLESFYTNDVLTKINDQGEQFGHELGLLRADHADGKLDGMVGGKDYTAFIDGIDLALQSDGKAVAASDLTKDNTNVACFTRGTLIRTQQGEVPIEDLQAGDSVWTQDNGFQPIAWIGSRQLREAELKRNPNLLPIRIRKGALGLGLPERDLVVSPQHRILINSKIVRRATKSSEILVAAKLLTQLSGIQTDVDVTEMEYFHMMFDTHQLVIAEGTLAESLFLGSEALKGLQPAAQLEIQTLFPDLFKSSYVPQPVRPFVSGRKGRRIAARHLKNDQPLLLKYRA